MNTPLHKCVSLEQAEREIGDGWLALYRGDGWISRWIQYSTLGPYSHAALLCRENGHVDVLELREFIGPRRLPLAYHVERWPGRIDVFRPDLERWPEYKPKRAVEQMRELTSCEYSYRGVLTLLFRKIPLLRRRWALDVQDDLSGAMVSAAFCSEAVACADQFGGGVDAFPNKPNCLVTPNDLSHSLLRQRAFTIIGEAR